MRVRGETNYIEMSHHCYFPFQHFFSNFETVPFFFCDFCLDRTKWCILRNQRNERLTSRDVNSEAAEMGLVSASPVAEMGLGLASRGVGMGLGSASPVAEMGLGLVSPVAEMGLGLASRGVGMGLGSASPAVGMGLGLDLEVLHCQTKKETFYDQPLLALQEEILIRTSWWPSKKNFDITKRFTVNFKISCLTLIIVFHFTLLFTC